jgi:hypothetical protein
MRNHFYFGAIHPVACTLSRLLEELSLATTLQGVYFIFYIFLPLRVSALAHLLQAKYIIILGPKHVAAKIYKINTLKSCCERRFF